MRPQAYFPEKKLYHYEFSFNNLLQLSLLLAYLGCAGQGHHYGERPHRPPLTADIPVITAQRSVGVQIPWQCTGSTGSSSLTWRKSKTRSGAGSYFVLVTHLSSCPWYRWEGGSNGEQGRSSGGLHLGAQRSQIWYPHLVSFYWVLCLVLSYSRYNFNTCRCRCICIFKYLQYIYTHSG